MTKRAVTIELKAFTILAPDASAATTSLDDATHPFVAPGCCGPPAVQPEPITDRFRRICDQCTSFGKIEAADEDAVHRGLDVAAMGIVRIARQAAPGFDGLHAARRGPDVHLDRRAE